MPAKYTKDQYWKIYETLPQQLKEAVFSAETADHIFEICETHKVQEVSKVAAEVGDVLMGLTLPKDFQAALQKQVGLKPAVAQNIAQGINRLVFYPAKEQLEQIHRTPGEKPQQVNDIGVATPRHTAKEDAPEDDYTATENTESEKQEDDSIVEKPQPKSADQYREAPE